MSGKTEAWTAFVRHGSLTLRHQVHFEETKESVPYPDYSWYTHLGKLYFYGAMDSVADEMYQLVEEHAAKVLNWHSMSAASRDSWNIEAGRLIDQMCEGDIIAWREKRTEDKAEADMPYLHRLISLCAEAGSDGVAIELWHQVVLHAESVRAWSRWTLEDRDAWMLQAETLEDECTEANNDWWNDQAEDAIQGLAREKMEALYGPAHDYTWMVEAKSMLMAASSPNVTLPLFQQVTDHYVDLVHWHEKDEAARAAWKTRAESLEDQCWLSQGATPTGRSQGIAPSHNAVAQVAPVAPVQTYAPYSVSGGSGYGDYDEEDWYPSTTPYQDATTTWRSRGPLPPQEDPEARGKRLLEQHAEMFGGMTDDEEGPFVFPLAAVQEDLPAATTEDEYEAAES